jgi:hypothetical protein
MLGGGEGLVALEFEGLSWSTIRTALANGDPVVK